MCSVTGVDDVERLLEHLKALPLVDDADLDRPGAAYAAFEPVLSAALRAAVVHVPRRKRNGVQGECFRAFVRDHFPEGRGRGDDAYAANLWRLRSAFVKEKRTDRFVLTHGQPDDHLIPAADGRPTLNLESLVADFRSAVDELGPVLRRTDELRRRAAAEVERSTVHVTSGVSHTTTTTTVVFRGATAAKAVSGTN